MPPTKGGTSSLANALSLVTAWETWFLPGPQPVDPALLTNPIACKLDAHYPENFEQPTFPASNSIPISMGKKRGNPYWFPTSK